MASSSSTSILALFILVLFSLQTPAIATVYFSKSTLFNHFNKMINTFKIFIYPNTTPFSNFTTPPISLFHTSLLKSEFITLHPNRAHLFFLPFAPQSTRSLARVLQQTRTSFPFWDRSLGADHFFLSCQGVGPSSARNLVELKKNAVQVTCFTSPAREFVPHKDITLPPPSTISPILLLPSRAIVRRMGYWRFKNNQVRLVASLRNDHDFMIESEPSDEATYVERVGSSKFCLFDYEGEVVGLGEALALGCVPVVITNRPIQDLPLMDVIRWSEIALFVGAHVGPENLKRVLNRTWEDGTYERMKSLGAAVAHHFVWNEEPQPYDAFHMVMYQLWLRRHAIKYAKWDRHVSSA